MQNTKREQFEFEPEYVIDHYITNETGEYLIGKSIKHFAQYDDHILITLTNDIKILIEVTDNRESSILMRFQE